MAQILAAAELPPQMRDRIAERARDLVAEVRRERHGSGGIDAFLHEYALSSQEGVALLCLAEALLRIPDADTIDRLIRDKLARADWARHLGHSESLFVNASTWALMLTGRFLHAEPGAHDLRAALAPLHRALGRAGGAPGGHRGDAHPRPPVRHGPHHRRGARPRPPRPSGRAIAIPTTCSARRRAPRPMRRAISHAYERRDRGDRRVVRRAAPVIEAPGISVKLSALHPRYEKAQRERVLAELPRRCSASRAGAAEAGIGFTIDAEEADRLDLSLDLVEALALAPELAGWDGLGLAVQAYQKRALAAARLARRPRRPRPAAG